MDGNKIGAPAFGLEKIGTSGPISEPASNSVRHQRQGDAFRNGFRVRFKFPRDGSP
jgi:hypothetical protein